VLMFASAWVIIVHRHSSEANSSSCQVCGAAHSTSPAVVSPAPKPVVREVLTVRCQSRDAKQHFVAFALYIRPPPIG
jgi:hypothetical protein